jgi:hypothetical protein
MNCHLLVPNLFWPAAAGTEPYRDLPLPALETLLARGRCEKTTGSSLERWLAAAFLAAEAHDLPLAPFALCGDGGEPGDHWWLQSDPVHLSIHGDRLILADESRIAVTADEAQQLTAALNSHFAREGIAFVAPRPQRWYARIASAPRLRTTPTNEVAGRSIERFLPAGKDGARWRGIINEAQMLLHPHPSNESRESRGELTINSVWFWGAGCRSRLACGIPYAAVWSGHPLAAGLALAGGIRPQPLPEAATSLLPRLDDAPRNQTQLVALAPLPGTAYGDVAAWREVLLALEQRWFAPLLTAAQGTTFDRLTLHALGPDFSLACEFSRHDRLRFWRSRRPLHTYAG